DAGDTTDPTVEFSPTSLSAQYTQSAIAAVTFTATPSEDVTLYVNGVSIGAVSSGSAQAITLGTDVGSYTYLIKAVDASSNESVEYTFAYEVIANPIETVDPIVTYITGVMTQTTAAITFSSNETGYVDIQYGLTESYGNGSASYAVLPDAGQTITLAGLTCGTTYHYTLRAEDLAGNRGSGGDQTFRTLDCDAVDTIDPIVTLITGVATQTTLAITFTSNETGYAGIEYGVSDSFGYETVYTAISADVEKTITLAGLTCGTTYHNIIRVQDLAGNRGNTGDLIFTTEACPDTTAPTIDYTPIANQYNVSEVPANIAFTIADDTAVTSLTLYNGSLTGNVFSSLSGGVYTLTLSTGLGLHEYTLIAGDAAGNTTTVTVTYNVVPDDVNNINIYGFVVQDLTSEGVTVYWETDAVASDSQVIFQTNGSTIGVSATISGTDNYVVLSTGLTANETYSVVLKSQVTGQSDYTRLSFTIETALSNDGIIIDSIKRIYDADPVAGGGYASGYHFRFGITLNDWAETLLQFKLANRSNGYSSMDAANNTLVRVSKNGTSDYSTGTTLLTADTYTTVDNDISDIDSKRQIGGRQVYLDLFYKIPSGAGGVYTTTYGINAH
ncbi:MAG: hypothetical protein WC875_00445, partial [Candidatus Absconditabacterales bacterium]